MPVMKTFPASFLWGAATSAYQVEGSPLADGAGASTWHRFSHSPGRTHDGATGDVGYLHGAHAPGHANLFEAPIAARHLMLAHAAALERYRAGRWPHEIGIVINLEPKDAASAAPQDVLAAQRAHTYFNEQYLDPL